MFGAPWLIRYHMHACPVLALLRDALTFRCECRQVRERRPTPALGTVLALPCHAGIDIVLQDSTTSARPSAWDCRLTTAHGYAFPIHCECSGAIAGGTCRRYGWYHAAAMTNGSPATAVAPLTRITLGAIVWPPSYGGVECSGAPVPARKALPWSAMSRART